MWQWQGCLLLCALLLPLLGDNVGWKAYFAEDSSEFHDLPLAWEDGREVPEWLSGTYVRNGPAQLSFEGNQRRKFTSWLDGFAKLHSFKFSGSKVLYSGKMLESPNYLESVRNGELAPSITLNKFGSLEEEWSWSEKIQILVKSLMLTAFDNNNPALWRIGSESLEDGVYLAVTDSPVVLRFNLTTLETQGMLYPNFFPMTVAGCAHWIREPGTDNSINFQRKMSLGGGVQMEVQRYRPGDHYTAPQVIATFVPKKLSSIHSFSVTKNFVIFFFYPVVIDEAKIWEANFHAFELLTWLEEENTDVYVVDLRTGQVSEYETEPTYSAHHANAFEEGDELVVDLCPTPYINLKTYLDLENQLNPPEILRGISTTADQEFSRYRINMKTSKVSTTSFQNTIKSIFINNFDFPTINEAYRGVAYCWVYGWSAIDYSRMALTKKNVCDSTKDKVYYLENHYSSEMHFLARPGGAEEDDGVLVTIVFDGEKEKSYLLLLDAQSFQPLDRAYLPHNIPWSAHGMHFPEAKFPSSTSPAPGAKPRSNPRGEL